MRTRWFYLAFLVLITVPLRAAPTYTINNLGSLGGNRSDAFAINEAGIAAGVSRTVNGQQDVPVWHDGVALRALSDSSGQANAINGKGSVAGVSYIDGQRRATVWTSKGARELATLGGREGEATGINESGHVVGSSTTVSGAAHAFLETADAMIDLGTLGGGWSSAYAINNSDDVVGYSMTRSGYMQAFFWQAETGMRALPGLGGRNSYAFDINDKGAAVGAANTRSGQNQAYIHRDGSSLGLGTLGGAMSVAYGVNNFDQVVGYSSDSQGRMRAFLWLNGTLFDLNSLVESIDGWTLDAAYGINDAGQIVGTGMYNGIASAFRLDPVMQRGNIPLALVHQTEVPEPSSALLLVIGVLALGLGKAPLSRHAE